MLQTYAAVKCIVGKDVMKQVMAKEVMLQDYEHIVCNVSLLPEIIPLRGILKTKFPAPDRGTASPNTVAAVDAIVNGVMYSTQRDKYDMDFAKIVVPVGKLQMADDQIESNIGMILSSVV